MTTSKFHAISSLFSSCKKCFQRGKQPQSLFFTNNEKSRKWIKSMNTESSPWADFYVFFLQMLICGNLRWYSHHKDNYFKGKTVLPSCKYNMYEPECEKISQPFYLNVKLAASSALSSSPITTIWRRSQFPSFSSKMCYFGNCNIKMNNKDRHTVTFAFNSNLHSKY